MNRGVQSNNVGSILRNWLRWFCVLLISCLSESWLGGRVVILSDGGRLIGSLNHGRVKLLDVCPVLSTM